MLEWFSHAWFVEIVYRYTSKDAPSQTDKELS